MSSVSAGGRSENESAVLQALLGLNLNENSQDLVLSDTELEDGEILEEDAKHETDGSLRAPGPNNARNKRTKERKRKVKQSNQEEEERIREEGERIREEEERIQAEHFRQILKLVYDDATIHIHYVSKDSKYLQSVQEIENATGKPTSPLDPGFQALQTKWIYEEGLHLGIDQDDNSIVFASRITPWGSMSLANKNYFQETLQILMDWATCVNVIKINGSQKAKAPDKTHGEQGAALGDLPIQPPCGDMFGVGWHQAWVKGKDVSVYAPASASVAERYDSLSQQLPKVSNLYRELLPALLPAAGQSLAKASREGNIPSFSTLILDGNSPEFPFANSLTLTNNDFANFQHCDKDFIPIAYGLWWTSKCEFDPRTTCQAYSFDPATDHNKVIGGGFLWGEYAIGIDFQRACGLVEIYWRGKTDFHSTMLSKSPADATRWGTSIQLTKRGVNAIGRYWENANTKRAITPSDFLKKLSKPKSVKRRKT